jgi:hypothetical protein
VYTTLDERHPAAVTVFPPRADAVLSATVDIEPTQRDGHIQAIAGKGRMAWGRPNSDTGGEFIPQWSCDFLKGCEPRAAGPSGWNAVHPICDPHQVDGGGADDGCL